MDFLSVLLYFLFLLSSLLFSFSSLLFFFFFSLSFFFSFFSFFLSNKKKTGGITSVSFVAQLSLFAEMPFSFSFPLDFFLFTFVMTSLTSLVGLFFYFQVFCFIDSLFFVSFLFFCFLWIILLKTGTSISCSATAFGPIAPTLKLNG